MNREIKFRAWDKSMKKMQHPKLWDNTMPSNWDKHYELQQFTGLTDNNGKEIYEGDIVEFESLDGMSTPSLKIERHVIMWQETNCCFNIPWLRYGTLYFPNINSVKVIGNIFENPELINKL